MEAAGIGPPSRSESPRRHAPTNLGRARARTARGTRATAYSIVSDHHPDCDTRRAVRAIRTDREWSESNTISGRPRVSGAAEHVRPRRCGYLATAPAASHAAGAEAFVARAQPRQRFGRRRARRRDRSTVESARPKPVGPRPRTRQRARRANPDRVTFMENDTNPHVLRQQRYARRRSTPLSRRSRVCRRAAAKLAGHDRYASCPRNSSPRRSRSGANLHAHPELAFAEVRTAKFVCGETARTRDRDARGHRPYRRWWGLLAGSAARADDHAAGRYGRGSR